MANLLAHRLDRRLTGLADALDARYGRNADDLVFSGDRLPAHGLVARVTAIAAEEGFRVRPDKTRIAPAHHRQHVTGLVVNTHPAVPRAEFDALRALLHNCGRTGPEAQNRAEYPAFRDHLLGPRLLGRGGAPCSTRSTGAKRPAARGRCRRTPAATAWRWRP